MGDTAEQKLLEKDSNIRIHHNVNGRKMCIWFAPTTNEAIITTGVTLSEALQKLAILINKQFEEK